MQKSAGTGSCKVDPDLGDFQLNGRVGSSCKCAAVEDVTGTIGVLLGGGGCVCRVVRPHNYNREMGTCAPMVKS